MAAARNGASPAAAGRPGGNGGSGYVALHEAPQHLPVRQERRGRHQVSGGGRRRLARGGGVGVTAASPSPMLARRLCPAPLRPPARAFRGGVLPGGGASPRAARGGGGTGSSAPARRTPAAGPGARGIGAHPLLEHRRRAGCCSPGSQGPSVALTECFRLAPLSPCPVKAARPAS